MSDRSIHHQNQNEKNYHFSLKNKQSRRSRSRSQERLSNNNKIKLHIGNLPLDITENQLNKALSKYGSIKDINIVKRNQYGPMEKSCYAFVTAESQKEAENIIANFKGHKTWEVAYSKNDQDRNSSSNQKDNQKINDKKLKCNNNSRGSNDQYKRQYSRDEDKNKSGSYNQRQQKRNYKDKDDERQDNYRNKFQRYQSRQSPSESPPISYQLKKKQNINSEDINEQKTNQVDANDQHKTEEVNKKGEEISEDVKILLKKFENNELTEEELLTLMCIPTEQLESLIQDKTVIKLQSAPILVRELWVGNLPESCSESNLQLHMKIYGKIQHIDYHEKLGQINQNYAFVKYQKVQEASKAFFNVKTLSALLSAPMLKIFFSDHLRRLDVVGDADGCETKEDLTNILYFGFPYNSQAANEEKIKQVCSEYGQVKQCNLFSRENSTLKSYCLVEMGSVDQALKVKEKVNLKKYKLGDRKFEVAVLLNADKLFQKDAEFQKYYMQQRQQVNYQKFMKYNPQSKFFGNSVVQNQLVYQNYIPQQQQPLTFLSPPQYTNPSQNYSNQMPNPIIMQQANPQFNKPVQMNQYINPLQNVNLLQPIQNNTVYQPYNIQQQQPLAFLNIKPEQMPNMQNLTPQQQYIIPTQQQNSQNLQSFIPNSQHQNLQNINKENKTNILEIFSDLLNSCQSNNKNEEEINKNPPSNIIEEEVEAFWSGFISRPKQQRVGVDARVVSQTKDINISDYHLTISFRTNFDEAFKKEAIGYLIFAPSNQLYENIFDEYATYFKEKQKAGVIQTSEYYIYVLPQCTQTEKIISMKSREMMGVVCESRKNQTDKNNAYVDPNKEYDITDVPKPNMKLIEETSKQIQQKAINSSKNEAEQLTNLLNQNPDILNQLLASINDTLN